MYRSVQRVVGQGQLNGFCVVVFCMERNADENAVVRVVGGRQVFLDGAATRIYRETPLIAYSRVDGRVRTTRHLRFEGLEGAQSCLIAYDCVDPVPVVWLVKASFCGSQLAFNVGVAVVDVHLVVSPPLCDDDPGEYVARVALFGLILDLFAQLVVGVFLIRDLVN